jgi:hypothetical protein
VLLEDIRSEEAIDSMSDYNANVVTHTESDEPLGQVAQYLASAITNKQGDAAALP